MPGARGQMTWRVSRLNRETIEGVDLWQEACVLVSVFEEKPMKHVRSVLISAIAAFTLLALPTHRLAADSTVTSDAFLPGAKIVGATGTFLTDLEIFNPDTVASVNVRVYFTLADRDGSGAPYYDLDPPLRPRESVSFKDLLGNYFAVSSGYGLVEVKCSQPILVTSNTYNISGSVPGTYGQFSPGQPERSSLGFDNSIRGDLYATGIPNDSIHRTNAVVMNPSAVTLEAGVQLVNAVGQVLGTRVYTVPPYSMHQLNDIFGAEFASFSPPIGGPYRLNFFVNLSNSARILAYATITDRRTGDPYLVPAQGAFINSGAVASPSAATFERRVTPTP